MVPPLFWAEWKKWNVICQPSARSSPTDAFKTHSGAQLMSVSISKTHFYQRFSSCPVLGRHACGRVMLGLLTCYSVVAGGGRQGARTGDLKRQWASSALGEGAEEGRGMGRISIPMECTPDLESERSYHPRELSCTLFRQPCLHPAGHHHFLVSILTDSFSTFTFKLPSHRV